MEPIDLLLTLWAVLTTVLVVVVIYRSTLTMHEDDQLFLDDAESHIEQEQKDLHARVNRLNPIVNWLGASSGALILLIAGLWVWRGLNQM